MLASAFGAAAGAPIARASAAREAVALFDFAIAGAGYYRLNSVLHRLVPGTALVLAREPKNPHDANAVAVHTPDGLKLGFIPRRANPPVAHALDRGARLHAAVVGLLDAQHGVPEGLVFTGFFWNDPVVRLTAEDGGQA